MSEFEASRGNARATIVSLYDSKQLDSVEVPSKRVFRPVAKYVGTRVSADLPG